MENKVHYIDLHDEAFNVLTKASGLYELAKAKALADKNYRLMGELVDAGEAPMHVVIGIGVDINNMSESKALAFLN